MRKLAFDRFENGKRRGHMQWRIANCLCEFLCDSLSEAGMLSQSRPTMYHAMAHCFRLRRVPIRSLASACFRASACVRKPACSLPICRASPLF